MNNLTLIRIRRKEDKVIEVIAELIGLDANNKITSRLTKSKIKLFLEKIAKMIGDFINSITGQKPNKLMNLNSNSSIAEITNYLLDNKIDLSGKIGTKYSNLKTTTIKDADKKALKELFKKFAKIDDELSTTQISDTIKFVMDNALSVVDTPSDIDKIQGVEEVLRNIQAVFERIGDNTIGSSDKKIRELFRNITDDMEYSVSLIRHVVDIASRIGKDIEEVGDRTLLKNAVNELSEESIFLIKLSNKLIARGVSENKDKLSTEQIELLKSIASQLNMAFNLKFNSLKKHKQKD